MAVSKNSGKTSDSGKSSRDDKNRDPGGSGSTGSGSTGGGGIGSNKGEGRDDKKNTTKKKVTPATAEGPKGPTTPTEANTGNQSGIGGYQQAVMNAILGRRAKRGATALTGSVADTTKKKLFGL